MKTLQNNFTTPKQSKRLLDLGVPANSADCYYNNIGDIFILHHVGVYEDIVTSRNAPCWSVGRLMEIFDMCCINEKSSNDGWCSYRRLHKNQTYIDYILFVFTINKMRNLLDFSKLDE